MAELRKDIPVTNEFDGYEPPEDTRTYGGTYADDSRMMMEEPSRRTMFDEVETSSGAERSLDYATGGSPGRPKVSTGRPVGKKKGNVRTLTIRYGGTGRRLTLRSSVRSI